MLTPKIFLRKTVPGPVSSLLFPTSKLGPFLGQLKPEETVLSQVSEIHDIQRLTHLQTPPALLFATHGHDKHTALAQETPGKDNNDKTGQVKLGFN